MALTGLEVQFHDFEVDAVEERFDGFLADHVARDMETDRVNTLVQDVESLCVGSLRIIHFDVLAHKPQVVVFLVATNEREFAWQRVNRFQALQVFATIEGLHVEAFVGSPNQLLLEVRTFQIDLDFIEPFLTSRRNELREQFFSISHYLFN